MSSIRLDAVLRRSDTDAVVSAVKELENQRRLSGQGITQSRDGIRQFQFAADELNQWWVIVFDNGERQEYRDGKYTYRGRRPDESQPAEFFRPMPQALQLLWPTRLLTWANPHGSFYPVLAQHVGERSILFTFEHVDDPAFRQTLVLDERSGIAKRLIGYDYGLVITGLETLEHWNPEDLPAFEPITGPIPTDY
ncbi:hypothetical protein MRBLMI12_002424 [Microbacterium sp. LMI12-1-1.1]|uniref:hypothetical protein n=1 Tax=Microbacterium sp. LMI12-1-1.1 TaxID=3135225 RepID=UPI00343A2639